MIDTAVTQFAFLLSLLFLVYLAVETFRYYLNRQGSLSKELSRSSYPVYIIHTVVLGAIALVPLHTGIPSPLKHLILAVSTYAVSSTAVYAWRKVAGLGLSVQRVKYDNA